MRRCSLLPALLAACVSNSAEFASDVQDSQDTVPEGCCCACPDGSALRTASEDTCIPNEIPTHECDGECLPSCPEWRLPECTYPVWPEFAACARNLDAVASVEPVSQIDVSGIVQAAGDGAAEIGCRNDWSDAFLRVGGEVDEMAGFWFTIQDAVDQSMWTVEIIVPGATKPVLGSQVRIEALLHRADFAPSRGSFSVSNPGGNRSVWVGQTWSVSELNAPSGIQLAQGQRNCFQSDECGKWAGYDLDLTTALSTRHIRPGESVTVDDFRVTFGAAVLQTSEGTVCADWGVYLATAAIAWSASE